VNSEDPILKWLAEGPRSGADLARRLGCSRQAVHKRLRALVLSGVASRTGATRGAVFSLAGKEPFPRNLTVTRRIPLPGVAEDQVFTGIARQLDLEHALAQNVLAIVRYAFTEMLNNANDHSGAAFCTITVGMTPYDCSFTIRDRGIGIFHSIASKLGLPDETRAVEELLKGKTTTMAERHSGEGVFFTSKAGDVVAFRSHAFELVCDNTRDDVILRSCRPATGTEVRFRVARHSRQTLQALFREYAPEEMDYRFEKTCVHVRLYQRDYVSRSEARRVVTGLEKFSAVRLDFSGVNAIGQGFTDEIFRVFSAAHPPIRFQIENANESVKAMIRHTVDKSRIQEVDNRMTIAGMEVGPCF